MRIFKYEAPDPGETRDIPLPWGSRFLRAGMQGLTIVMWFEVEPELKLDDKTRFTVLATGAEVPDRHVWLDTVQEQAGDTMLTWHLYQDLSRGGRPVR